MPARSVVLEKLVKWDGKAHQDLTAGEYTQLTGRAGRRGIDVEGHSVVVEHPGFDVGQLGRLASRRTYPLVSSFQPSYNMTINLVAQMGEERAREVLELSFAQYQADQAVVGKARRAREADGAIHGYREAATCHKGDFMEYAALRERISRAQKEASKASGRARREATASTLAGLKRGDVVRVGGGRRAGLAVVVLPDNHPEAPRPTVVTDNARTYRLAISELHHGIEVVGAVRVPKGHDPRNARHRRELAAVVGEASGTFTRERDRQRATEAKHDVIDDLSVQLRSHPCHSCPDREAHARWAERYFRALRDKDKLVGEIERATGSIARIFDKRLRILTELEYLTEDREPTAAGFTMRKLYAENDLVVAECLRLGVWEQLHPPALAAAVSTLLYNGRREDETRTPRIPGGPGGVLGKALAQTTRVWSRIDDMHSAAGLGELPSPQWGIVGPIHGWAQGKSLTTVLQGAEIAPGDMVRWCKQVIDALDQISDATSSPAVRSSAVQAIAAMRRGVVAY
jgi:ATP-dependent RNA helicase HelY